MSLQFAEFYQNYTSKNLENGDKIFFKPNIPPKKLANAISSYAPHVKADDVFVLADETFFGKADNGLLITNSEIVVKEPFEDHKQIPLIEVQQVAFEGLLGGNFIVNHKKLITFTQLQKKDRNKLVDTVNAFLCEKMQLLAIKADLVYEEVSKENKIENIEKELSKSEEKSVKVFEKYEDMNLDKIIYSDDKVIIEHFIEENNLNRLNVISGQKGIHNPELYLNYKNLKRFEELLQEVGIEARVEIYVMNSISDIFNMELMLRDIYKKNKIFEILIHQNSVAVSLILMTRYITRGYLRAILSYMPSERVENIMSNYDHAFSLVLSQCLFASAAKKGLDDVLLEAKYLVRIDPNSDDGLIKNNRMQKIIEKNRDHDFDLFKDFIRDALNKDLLENANLEIDEEQYSFSEIKKLTSVHVRGCICKFLGGRYREDVDCLKNEVDAVLEYLEENIKNRLSKIYL